MQKQIRMKCKKNKINILYKNYKITKMLNDKKKYLNIILNQHKMTTTAQSSIYTIQTRDVLRTKQRIKQTQSRRRAKHVLDQG